MMAVVTGGSGSGKSAFAEDKILSLGQGKRFYIATMHPYDEESYKRVERHRKMRAGKGFETVECYTGLENLEFPQDAIVVLNAVKSCCKKCSKKWGRSGYCGGCPKRCPKAEKPGPSPCDRYQ